jgi:GT2 family glycosyltransferase
MSDPIPTLEPLSLRVSVILLAHNQAASLRRAVAALEQSEAREQFEIIVLDAASSDATRQIDTEFPVVQKLRLPHHMGASRALNIGVRTAKADLLMFLSPDVEVLPSTIRSLAEALEADPDTIAACPLLTDASGQLTPKLFTIPRPAEVSAPLAAQSVNLSESSPEVEFPSFDALMIRKPFVVAMNYFDQRYGHYWIDAEFAMQARRASKKIRLYPAIRAILHPGADPLADVSLAAVDKVTGAAEFAGKYGGGAFGVRLSAALGALGSFQVGRFFGILSGNKLDGSQAG